MGGDPRFHARRRTLGAHRLLQLLEEMRRFDGVIARRRKHAWPVEIGILLVVSGVLAKTAVERHPFARVNRRSRQALSHPGNASSGLSDTKNGLPGLRVGH